MPRKKKEPERPRRKRGTGSIWLRKDGRWSGQLDVQQPGEERRPITVYGESYEDVDAQLAELVRDRDGGRLAEPSELTVAQYLDIWLRDCVAPGRESYHRQAKSYIARQVSPRIGLLKLQELRAPHLQRMYAQIRKEGRVPKYQRKNAGAGLSLKTIHNIQSMMRVALDQAKRWKLIGENPAVDVTLPPAPKAEIHPLTTEQFARLALAAWSHRLGPLWMAYAHTGARRGELLGLLERDIVWEPTPHARFGTITVQRKQEASKASGETKTPAGRRTLRLTETAREILEEQIRRKDAERKAYEGTGEYVENGLVFTTSKGTPLSGRNVLRDFKKLLGRPDVALPDTVTIHDLRHTTATTLLKAGVDVGTVSDLLGHSDPAFTLRIYDHLIPAASQAAMDTLERALAASKPPESPRDATSADEGATERETVPKRGT